LLIQKHISHGNKNDYKAPAEKKGPKIYSIDLSFPGTIC